MEIKHSIAALMLTAAPQSSGGQIGYAFYYYDAKNDCELSFDAYAERLGYTAGEPEDVLLVTDPADCLYEASRLQGCIVDEESTVTAFAPVDSMYGIISYEVGGVVNHPQS